MLAAGCVLALIAGPREGRAQAALLAARGPPLSLDVQGAARGQARLRATMLAEHPGGHIPTSILRNINGLWNKSISGKREKNRKTGGFELPKEVRARPRGGGGGASRLDGP